MQRTIRLLLLLTLAAVAVPLVPFLAWGTRLDHLVAGWLDPPPSPPVLAALEVGILAIDILLPVPSSMVATLGGAVLGVALGTACGWLGMTIGAAAGFGLGRLAGSRAITGLADTDRVALERQGRRFGPLFVLLTRPLPLVAEAAALLAGAAGMPARDFLAAAAAGNLAIAFAWSLAGAAGLRADAMQWTLVGSLVVPVAIAAVVIRRTGRR